jgi:CzcA family heavy metal efflux pump
MMRWIVGASMQLRVLVVVIAALTMVFGVSQLRQMPVDVLPEFSQPYVEIQTESLGLSAEEVEQLITVPMEQDLLNGLPWLQSIRSESVPGLSSVVLMFQPGTDLMRARQMVSERMTQAVAMPHVSKPPTMLQPLSSSNRVMIIGLSSKSVSHINMSVLARWTIQPRLMGVPGVANVSIWGQRDRQLQVQVDPKRLEDKKVSLLQVLETTGNSLWVSSLSFVEASTPGTGGFIDTANQRLGIRHILPIVSPAELAQVPIEDAAGVRLSDVANVVENHQPLIGDGLTKDGPGLLLVVEKFPGANTLQVTRGVEDAMSELAPGLPGITVDSSIFRPADFIETSISNVGRTAIIGFVLLAIVLLVFFYDLRTALISLIAIPLSLIAAGLVLYFTGATFNMIVLTGFIAAIGVVVYDSIIDAEYIVRRLRNRTDRSLKATARVILDASHEARSAIIYAALIVLLAVAPIFFMNGTSGSFFRPLAISYGLAIVASMVVTLTVVPALCLMFVRNETASRTETPLVRWLQSIYEPALGHTIKRGGLAMVAVGALTVVGLAMLPFLSRAPMPAFKELSMLINLKAVPGTSQPEMSRISGRMGDELRKINGVRNVAAHIGRAVLGDQIVDVNSAELWVTIDPTANYNQTAKAIKTAVEGYPGLSYTVQTYLRKKSGDVIQEPEDNVVVRVFGDKYDVLGSTAADVKKAITGIQGIGELKVKTPIQEATLETEVDLVAAQKHGLKPGDVRRAAACLLSGIQVGALYEDQRVFDVVVWSTPETRHSLSSIADLVIDAPGGARVRLGDVAKVRIVPSASVIRHDGVKRYVDVVADVKGRELATVAGDIDQKLKGLKYPQEYYARVLGDYAAPKEAQNHFILITCVAALGVFFLLQSAFGSWRLAAISFLTIPAALIGGLLAAIATGGTVISLGALAGLLAVFGVAVCSSLTLIKHYQRLTAIPAASNGDASVDAEVAQFRAQFEPRNRIDGITHTNGAGFGPGLVQHGAVERLGPIVMTSVATALALVPALFLGDVPGLEIIRPMVIVTLGGLVTSTLFTLFGVPALFLLFGPGRGSDLDDITLTMTDEELREAMARAHVEQTTVSAN